MGDMGGGSVQKRRSNAYSLLGSGLCGNIVLRIGYILAAGSMSDVNETVELNETVQLFHI